MKTSMKASKESKEKDENRPSRAKQTERSNVVENSGKEYINLTNCEITKCQKMTSSCKLGSVNFGIDLNTDTLKRRPEITEQLQFNTLEQWRQHAYKPQQNTATRAQDLRTNENPHNFANHAYSNSYHSMFSHPLGSLDQLYRPFLQMANSPSIYQANQNNAFSGRGNSSLLKRGWLSLAKILIWLFL